MRQFRQTERGGWAAVIERVRQALAERALGTHAEPVKHP
jgi:hypothetical protein